MQDPNTTNQGD